MDIQLHYRAQGDGTPLVLLHGNGENLDYFEKQIDCFSAFFRVIAVDTRGHGRSPRGDAPFTLAQFVEDLRALLDQLAISKAHLLGFSDGANVALLFKLKYPRRVLRLVLNGANLCPRGVKARYQAPICAAYALWSALSPWSPKARARREMLGLMVREPHIAPDALSRLRGRVLVIAGSDDMIKAAHTRLIASAIPRAQLCLLAGDHFIARKCPECFNERVLRFLTTCG
ncbi:MAG: alpha/beta hydrolase [Clostridia bacterium]